MYEFWFYKGGIQVNEQGMNYTINDTETSWFSFSFSHPFRPFPTQKKTNKTGYNAPFPFYLLQHPLASNLCWEIIIFHSTCSTGNFYYTHGILNPGCHLTFWQFWKIRDKYPSQLVKKTVEKYYYVNRRRTKVFATNSFWG